jgi:hypothetical protein
MCKKICIDRYAAGQRGFRAVGFTKKFWPKGQTLRIRFLGGTPADQEFVKKTAPEWLKYANLKFEWVTSGDSHIRIAFDSRDGAWSFIGTDCLEIAPDQPTMNLGWVDQSVVLHEFGHALGLGHEHQNPKGGIQWNENAVVADLSGYPNYWDYNTIHWNVIQRYSEDEVVGTEVDPKSIMMYAIPQEWTLDNFEAGFNETLSAQDKVFIATVYPKDPVAVDDTPLDFARELFVAPIDLKALPERVLVRLGRMLGLATDEKLSIRQNYSLVAKKLWP